MAVHPYTRLFPRTTAPTVDDDESLGFEVGDVWIDQTGNAVYHAVDVTDGAAVWSSGGTLDINALPEKTTIADDDVFVQGDSEDSFNLKKNKWTAISARMISDAIQEIAILQEQFDDDADGWTLGTGWSWNAGGWIEHDGSGALEDPATYPLLPGMVQAAFYVIAAGIGGTTGQVNLGLDTNFQYFNAGDGDVEFLVAHSGNPFTAHITPSADFDGTIEYFEVYRVKLIQEAPAGIGAPVYARQNESWVPLGTAAVADLGTGSGEVAEGDHTHPGGSAHTIQEEGTPLTARSNLNFVGGGVTATDDAGNDATVVTIPPNLTTEEVEDIVGAMVSGNTETGIAVTYDDSGAKLNFDAQTAGDARYAPIANGVTNGDSHDHAGGDGNQIDHGGLAGLGDDDHTQYQLKSLLTTLGDIIYASASAVWDRLAGNTTTTRKFLRQTGNGSVSAAPAWDTLVAGDIPDISATYAIAAKGVTNGDSHDHAGGDGSQIDHGGLAGLSDDDHTQYVRHNLSTASNDFLVGSGSNTWIKKTLAETITILRTSLDSIFALAANGVTNGDSHNHVGGDGAALTYAEMFHAHGLQQTIAASTTNWTCPGVSGVLAAENAMVIPKGGTLRNLTIRMGGTQPASGSLVCTLRVNGADTALVVTIAAGSGAGNYQDTTHTVALSDLDRIGFKIVNNATGTSGTIAATVVQLDRSTT